MAWGRPRGRRALATLMVLGVAWPVAAGAQLTKLLPKPAPAETAATTTVAPDSPRAAVAEFLRDARRGDWPAAAEFLALGNAAERARGAELAQRLKAVLDRRLALDIETLSPRASGDTADGLSAQRERVGEFIGPEGEPARVRLERQVAQGEARWVFSAATVGEIDRWYEALDDAWLRDRLPPGMLRAGPLDVPWWQWIAVVLMIPVLTAVAWVLGRSLRQVLGAIAQRTPSSWDDVAVARLSGPFRLWIAAMLARPLLSLLALNSGFLQLVDSAARGLAWIAFFWAGLRGISIVQEQLAASSRLSGAAQTRALVPLAGRVLRVTFVVLAVLTTLAQFGYPVGTLLAGLGIGGVALALASQKTVEHLFGSVSLAADRTFAVGDFVRVDGIEGTVEAIGLRSTQVRTPDRTLVKFPNGRLAEMKIETFGERDRIRLLAPFGVEYGTTSAALRAIFDDVTAMLRAHPRIWPETIIVDFIGFGESSLDCRLVCWFQTTDVLEFNAIRTQVLLELMQIVERHGASFAFPTRTVRVTGEGATRADVVRLAAQGGAD